MYHRVDVETMREHVGRAADRDIVSRLVGLLIHSASIVVELSLALHNQELHRPICAEY